ncbi:MAG: ligase-associated DNA damage response endonuclease PdeM [Hyphomonadaceae bacterium]
MLAAGGSRALMNSPWVLTERPALATVAAMYLTQREPTPARVLQLDLAGESLALHPCGGLWWGAAGVLVVSDLHLEKASSYAVRGQMLPPYDTRATLKRLGVLLADLKPTTVVCLGDSFHDRRSRPRMAEEDVAAVRAMTAAHDWIWIEGNHDPAPPEDLGGRAAFELRMGALTLRHEPTNGAARGEVAGHLHPCARVVGRSGRSVRTRCFATDGQRLVMPAYGALTGGLNVLDEAYAPLFAGGMVAAVMGRDGVYLAGPDSLAPDRRGAAA